MCDVIVAAFTLYTESITGKLNLHNKKLYVRDLDLSYRGSLSCYGLVLYYM